MIERLSDLLAKFSESLSPDEGNLRDQIGMVREAVSRREEAAYRQRIGRP